MAKNKKKIIERKILQQLKQRGTELSAKSLSKLLDIHKSEYHQFRAAIEKLKKENRIQKVKKTSNYIIAQKKPKIEGELRIARGGFGFVIEDNNENDVFINEYSSNSNDYTR
jgi:ribonuclease R